MAIDFGRMARGVATGYLSAKIANTEANDALNANIIERAGLNFYENTLPEWEAGEKVRKETYNKVSSRYGKDVANYMDQNGFTNYNEIVEMLGANNNINETKLKAYLEGTSAGTYGERAEERASKIQNKEKTIMGLTSGSSKIGNMTAELLLKDDETATDAGTGVVPETTTEEVTIPGEMVPGTPIKKMDTVETREVPVESKTADLPSYEEIFGDGTEKAETVFLKMTPENQVRYRKLSDAQFKADTLNEVSGMRSLQIGYKEDYNNLSEDIKKQFTLNEYARERYFKEKFLPNQGLSYQTIEPSDISQAKTLINYYNSIGDDNTVEEIKNRLRSKGYNLTDYNL